MINTSLELMFWFAIAVISVFTLMKLPKNQGEKTRNSSGDPLLVDERTVRTMSNIALLTTFETFATMGRITNVEPGMTFLRNELNERLTTTNIKER